LVPSINTSAPQCLSGSRRLVAGSNPDTTPPDTAPESLVMGSMVLRLRYYRDQKSAPSSEQFSRL